MVKILSQEEIDSLIKTVGGQDTSDELFEEESFSQEKNIVAYDFKHPNRVNKDQIRGVESLHDNFANQLGSSYSSYTRSVVDVDLIAVDQITYHEYIMSLPSPSCSYIVQLEPLEGAGIISFSTSVAFLIVDKIFGGKGKPIETERELTGIERSVMAKVIDRTLTPLERVWANIHPIKFKITNFESNPQFIQIVPPGETVIVVSLQVKMAGSYGVMTVCYPYISLEEIIQTLSTQNWIETLKRRRDDKDAKSNVRALNLIETPVSVRLTGTTITMRELLKLGVGDVICTDSFSGDEFTVLVGDKPKFKGIPGYIGKKRAVNITRLVGSSEFDNNELKDKFKKAEI
ncbi:MAG: flagellar motor switch protein FliM [candidate division Zixibacteria bacterium]|nr:flagellar motor switch protein FliM [candidate division Zixibacteria bacterium]